MTELPYHHEGLASFCSWQRPRRLVLLLPTRQANINLDYTSLINQSRILDFNRFMQDSCATHLLCLGQVHCYLRCLAASCCNCFMTYSSYSSSSKLNSLSWVWSMLCNASVRKSDLGSVRSMAQAEV